MEDDEIVIGINRNNTNSNNKNNSNKNKKHKKKKKIDFKNSSNSLKASDSKGKSKSVIKEKTNRIKKSDNSIKNQKTKSDNINEKRRRSKKIGAKSRIGVALENSKDSIETKNMKAKVITAVFCIFVFIIILLSSNIFNIKDFIVNDNNILSDEAIISLSGIEKFTNIFRFNKIAAKNNIETNAYIEEVKIKRKLPSTVEITVKERIPTFMLQYADSFVYINNQGYILEISNEKLGIPLLEGCTTDLVNIKPGNRINEEDLKKMNTVIKIFEIAKSNELGDLITKIDISNTKNYTIVLESEGKTVYLGDCNDSDLNTKMLYLKSIVDASQGRAGEVFLNINLNSQNVYVRWSTE